MRVLAACSLGGAGHLGPLLPFLAAARRRGDDTVVVGPPALRPMLEETGHTFELGGEPPEHDVAPIREQLPRVSAPEASILANRELFGHLATAAMLPRMEAICEAWRPDVVLRDPCEYASAVAAARLGIRTAQVAISLADAEAGSIAVAAPALEAHHRGLVTELRAAPYLTRFPASLDPSPFEATLRFGVPEEAHAPLPDWWAGSEAPLIYVTFGTVLGHMSIAAGVLHAVLGALRDIEARVLLTVGRQLDTAQLNVTDTGAARVRVEAWVDQVRVLEGAEVVVCHGGSGTVLGALAAGVPMVVVPVFADQFENGSRVERCGAGVLVAPEASGAAAVRRVVDDRDAPRIAAAIERVRRDPSYRRQASLVAAEMAAAPSVDAVLDAVFTGPSPGPGRRR